MPRGQRNRLARVVSVLLGGRDGGVGSGASHCLLFVRECAGLQKEVGTHAEEHGAEGAAKTSHQTLCAGVHLCMCSPAPCAQPTVLLWLHGTVPYGLGRRRIACRSGLAS